MWKWKKKTLVAFWAVQFSDASNETQENLFENSFGNGNSSKVILLEKIEPLSAIIKKKYWLPSLVFLAHQRFHRRKETKRFEVRILCIKFVDWDFDHFRSIPLIVLKKKWKWFSRTNISGIFRPSHFMGIAQQVVSVHFFSNCNLCEPEKRHSENRKRKFKKIYLSCLKWEIIAKKTFWNVFRLYWVNQIFVKRCF